MPITAKWMNASFNLLLTATPFFNGVHDFRGYIDFLFIKQNIKPEVLTPALFDCQGAIHQETLLLSHAAVEKSVELCRNRQHEKGEFSNNLATGLSPFVTLFHKAYGVAPSKGFRGPQQYEDNYPVLSGGISGPHVQILQWSSRIPLLWLSTPDESDNAAENLEKLLLADPDHESLPSEGEDLHPDTELIAIDTEHVQVLGAVFKAHQQDITMGSFKGAIPPYPGYAKVPDFVTMDRSGVAMAVGEAEVPYKRMGFAEIPEHIENWVELCKTHKLKKKTMSNLEDLCPESKSSPANYPLSGTQRTRQDNDSDPEWLLASDHGNTGCHFKGTCDLCLGQLVAQMRTCSLRSMVFVKRAADSSFLLSPPIKYDTMQPSLRQSFAGFGLMALSEPKYSESTFWLLNAAVSLVIVFSIYDFSSSTVGAGIHEPHWTEAKRCCLEVGFSNRHFIYLVEHIPEIFTESRFLSDNTYGRLDENTLNAFTPVPAGFVACLSSCSPAQVTGCVLLV
ncbi:hypothetical protein CNMCM5793_008362 [Aspergillus hiratsukae]|uniref:Uncharacterized protein n=1 Tax=Aspergillus hiratsukae TaxID=1194566 RepID=A0A8H6PRE4_9EURO|nr:hypothetical protein CNMCM5793_008362 [Aspergillus hiratsukae]KAF7159326.1 hypothetical protein CNMCM6106_006539 [Aspergillus hiratsukae]